MPEELVFRSEGPEYTLEAQRYEGILGLTLATSFHEYYAEVDLPPEYSDVQTYLDHLITLHIDLVLSGVMFFDLNQLAEDSKNL